MLICKARVCTILWLALLMGTSSCVQYGNDRELSSKQTGFPTPVQFDLDKIRERGSLVAIVDNSSTSYFIYKGQPMGYEYELLSRLTKELGVELILDITEDIDEAIAKLNRGDGDIIAHNLTVTKKRADIVSFTEHLSLERQVLVQRKPENWRRLKLHQIDQLMIREPLDLIGKRIHVRKSSSFITRLHNLSEEIGGDIIIVEEPGNVEVEALIQKVADGDIDYTIADENVAKVNATYYPNIDIGTPISFSQRIAWGLRKNAPQLKEAVNTWITKIKGRSSYYAIYNKYFKSPRASLERKSSMYSSIVGNQISPYDSLIMVGAQELAWDWELLAAMIYQESKFNPRAESWVGAAGLMQLLPETAAMYGARNIYDPKQSIIAGVSYLKWLDQLWQPKVPDPQERIKFVLASYNVGQGHVLDARKLASKYGKNPRIWEGNVEYYLERKSSPEFYNDPVVTAGYCRGLEPVKYVKEVLQRSEQYRQLMEKEPLLTSL